MKYTQIPTIELNQLRTDLRNKTKLHASARARIVVLEAENKKLKLRVKELEETVATQATSITDLSLQMEELRTMVFGKKKNSSRDDDDSDTPPKAPPTKESYQRPVPKESEITHRVHHPLNHSHTLTKTRTKLYYVEDIPIQTKIVTRHTVEQSYCHTCNSWISAAPLPTSRVIIGDNVRRYIVYLNTLGRLSYSQIREILFITYELNISDGEISKILKQQSITERPAYEKLAVSIRKESSVHMDETGWNLQKGDGYRRYAWDMVGGDSGNTVFLLGKTRGKGNATNLLQDSKAVLVTDDYGAYRNLEQPHQLCWAHIHRKLRDLATSTTLASEIKDHCRESYRTFKRIYANLRETLQAEQSETTLQSFTKQLSAFSVSHRHDPTKLQKIKKQISDRLDCYLTCLQYPNVISDNNPAERALRHLVLKRKVSLGSFSEETAERTAVLLSVLMSRRDRGELREWVIGV